MTKTAKNTTTTNTEVTVLKPEAVVAPVIIPEVVVVVDTMKTFKTANCEIKYSVEDLKLQNLLIVGSTVTTVKSKSELFRNMYDAGMEICEIAKECASHYSFVYGVISSSREVRTVVKTSKSDDIRKLVDDGKTPGEIAKLLNSNYSFVFSVVKKYKSSLEVAAK